MADKLRLGIITSTHGLKGEVRVYPFTDRADRFEEIPKVRLLKQKSEPLELEIERVHYFKNMVLLKFRGVDRVEDAVKLVQSELWIDRDEAPDPGSDLIYVADLIGLTARDENGEVIGTVKDILQMTAQDLYVIDRGGKEVLVPNVPEFIRGINLKEGTVTVHVIDGLLDV